MLGCIGLICFTHGLTKNTIPPCELPSAPQVEKKAARSAPASGPTACRLCNLSYGNPSEISPWLVVDKTPMKNHDLVSWDEIPNGKIKFMFQTTNQQKIIQIGSFDLIFLMGKPWKHN